MGPYETGKDFYVYLPSPNRKPGICYEEACEAARLAALKMGSIPYLGLSGGLDSEVMALAFIGANIPFVPLILKFKEGLNYEDVRHAEDFCREQKLLPKIIEVDAFQFFLQRNYMEPIDKYGCISAEVALHLQMLEALDSEFVLGGEAFRAFQGSGEVEFRALSEIESSYFKFAEKFSPQSVANFHFSTPELMWAFFEVSLKLRSPAYPDDHDSGFYKDKLLFYRQCGFDLKDRPLRHQKLHGFEDVKRKLDNYLASHNSSYQLWVREPLKVKRPPAPQTRITFDRNNNFVHEILRLG